MATVKKPAAKGSNIYQKVPIKKQSTKVNISTNFCQGAFVEITGAAKKRYLVEFKEGDNPLYRKVIETNNWTRCTLQYYVNYTIKITDIDTQQVVHNETMDLNGKTVYIELGSSSLGDTLAWMPYLDQFQKKHNCKLIAMTYFNHLFKESYPNIKFIGPGVPVNDLYAWYNIGWNYVKGPEGSKPQWNVDFNKHKTDFRLRPIQQTAADILGLDYVETKPILTYDKGKRPVVSKKYVCIANHATLQAKYWNNKAGWKGVVDHLRSRGYAVVLLSKEEDGFNGNDNPKGVVYPKNYEMGTIINYLNHCDLFIGLGSGLTWLSWALGKPTVLISGFSEPYSEINNGIVRISAKPEVCSGCFNRHKLQESGDWFWCPDHQDTKRQFECTRSITPKDVIAQIQPLLKAKK